MVLLFDVGDSDAVLSPPMNPVQKFSLDAFCGSSQEVIRDDFWYKSSDSQQADFVEQLPLMDLVRCRYDIQMRRIFVFGGRLIGVKGLLVLEWNVLRNRRLNPKSIAVDLIPISTVSAIARTRKMQAYVTGECTPVYTKFVIRPAFVQGRSSW